MDTAKLAHIIAQAGLTELIITL